MVHFFLVYYGSFLFRNKIIKILFISNVINISRNGNTLAKQVMYLFLFEFRLPKNIDELLMIYLTLFSLTLFKGLKDLIFCIFPSFINFLFDNSFFIIINLSSIFNKLLQFVTELINSNDYLLFRINICHKDVDRWLI
jgi:hypothetical protein